MYMYILSGYHLQLDVILCCNFIFTDNPIFIVVGRWVIILPAKVFKLIFYAAGYLVFHITVYGSNTVGKTFRHLGFPEVRSRGRHNPVAFVT